MNKEKRNPKLYEHTLSARRARKLRKRGEFNLKYIGTTINGKARYVRIERAVSWNRVSDAWAYNGGTT